MQSTAALEGIIGSSEPMLEACRLVEKVSPSNATVLLLGETGTGKELFARAVHRLSTRRDGPFVGINCAAIPEPLLEAELFGYEKGAYTGAHKQTKGKIELAVNGSLLLDEIGDMPLALQAKLLRFFQERVVERIGGRELIPVDVRIICATHQDLPAMIRRGQIPRGPFLPHQPKSASGCRHCVSAAATRSSSRSIFWSRRPVATGARSAVFPPRR